MNNKVFITRRISDTAGEVPERQGDNGGDR
jgi:hypothetical protein